MQAALDPRLRHAGMTGLWRFLSSAPQSGQANMDLDRQLLATVETGGLPTLRFFRFSEPTVSFGRLQTLNAISAQIPAGWPAVQRPTGGGLVFHKDDLCFSLCWPNGLAPLPSKPSDQYRWIHATALEALSSITALRMAACCDVPPSATPFEKRECFSEPVGYDLLEGSTKRLGGALYRTRHATLYQGALHLPLQADDEPRLQRTFLAALNA